MLWSLCNFFRQASPGRKVQPSQPMLELMLLIEMPLQFIVALSTTHYQRRPKFHKSRPEYCGTASGVQNDFRPSSASPVRMGKKVALGTAPQVRPLQDYHATATTVHCTGMRYTRSTVLRYRSSRDDVCGEAMGAGFLVSVPSRLLSVTFLCFRARSEAKTATTIIKI